MLSEAAPTIPRIDLHGDITRAVRAVLVVVRIATLVMVLLGLARDVETEVVPAVPAALVCGAVGAWGLILVALMLSHRQLVRWPYAVDLGVTATGAVVLGVLARPEPGTANITLDLEPLAVSTALTFGLGLGTRWGATVASAGLIGAYALAQVFLGYGNGGLLNLAGNIAAWLAAAWCSYVLISRLRVLADRFAAATERLVRERERVAGLRASTEERSRHFHAQMLRFRALHDGPLRALTAVAGPGLAAHPDPEVRRHCVAGVNVLRGIFPAQEDGDLTDLAMALIEAGNSSSPLGLRVDYLVERLPDVPAAVTRALQAATEESLTNAATHSRTGRARVSAFQEIDGTVTVSIVDQGVGFDPHHTSAGYGIRHSILARMAEVGGGAAVESATDQGTRVELRWPT